METRIANTIFALFLAFLAFLACLAVVPGVSAADEIVEKVVYHVDDGARMKMALGNVRNHLNATDGKVKIVVLVNGPAVELMQDGAMDKDANPYNIAIEELMARGVDFRVCNNSLHVFNVDPGRVLPGVRIVPSGVAELGHLQAREDYVYIKP